MSGEIRRVITIEEIQLYSTDLDLPGAQPDRVTRQRDLQPQPLPIRLAQWSDRQLSGIVVRIKSLLRSLPIDHLAKITLLVQQPNSDHRNAQIAGRFELIAGHIAQPARVDRQSFAQHELHAEIRDAGQGGLWILSLKPCRRLRRVMLGLEQFVDVLTKSWIGEHALNLIARNRLQHNPGVLREFPQRGIE